MHQFFSRFTFSFPILLLNSILVQGHCCSGGSGSPIAGGASQGVLPERQMELNTNVQFINTDKFFTDDSPDTIKYFDGFKRKFINKNPFLL